VAQLGTRFENIMLKRLHLRVPALSSRLARERGNSMSVSQKSHKEILRMLDCRAREKAQKEFVEMLKRFVQEAKEKEERGKRRFPFFWR